MTSVAAATRHTYVDRESLNHALTSDLVGWTVSETREAPLLTHVVPHRLGDIRLIELSGNPLGAVRGHAEISGDSDTYLGILYQRSGSTLCRIGHDRVIVGPGEISVWHSERPVSTPTVMSVFKGSGREIPSAVIAIIGQGASHRPMQS